MGHSVCHLSNITSAEHMLCCNYNDDIMGDRLLLNFGEKFQR